MRLRLAFSAVFESGMLLFIVPPAMSTEVTDHAAVTRPAAGWASATDAHPFEAYQASHPRLAPRWTEARLDLAEGAAERFDRREARMEPRAWTPPLARDLPDAYRASDRGPQSTPPGPRQPSTAARWITETALLVLSGTGKISGTGRDTTGDIGKPPLGIRDASQGHGVQGAIK
jgi:hypothetical protein